jgi:hypothetical protein
VLLLLEERRSEIHEAGLGEVGEEVRVGGLAGATRVEEERAVEVAAGDEATAREQAL